MRLRCAWVLMWVAAWGLVACGGNPGAGGNNNNGFIPCEGIEDCPPGYECESNICAPNGDAGVEPDAALEADIEVDPEALDFGNPLLNVPVQQTLTITNVGGEDLTIFSILLEEDDTNPEFDATPVGNLSEVLAPGELIEVEVELINVDTEVDTGRLIINSDDADEAMVQVPLVSELKGDGLLGTCVMLSDDLHSPCVTNPEEIDFGSLTTDASAFADVSVFNTGTGNTPLTVTNIFATNNSGYGDQYTLTIVRRVPDPSTPGAFLDEELTDFPAVPVLLEPDDGVGAPEALLVHVRFDALPALQGQPVPPEFLMVQTDDASNPSHEIPFVGQVLCPEGVLDIPAGAPFCEYACVVTTSGTEICNDGLDNNCDGDVDEGCPVCGNGVVEPPWEACDDGNNDNGDLCPDGPGGSCRLAFCGDGFVYAGIEECDDGNSDNSDACLDDTANGGSCTEAFCGDGVVQVGAEGCDDGNDDNSDGCPDGPGGSCYAAVCGDGFVHAGVEECDDGSTLNSDTTPDACRRTCELPTCGDNVVDTGEMCDDGNTIAGDGCSTDCTSDETCGNGVLDIGEECDDGNYDNDDACLSGPFQFCHNATCGDGFVWAGVEDCEPPNVGDCDAECRTAGAATYDGCFSVIPAPSYYCAYGYVSLSFSCVQFVVIGNQISVTTNTTSTQPCTMSGTIDTATGDFSATCSYLGGCDEYYTVTGNFSDYNTWTGTFTSQFVGGLGCADCTTQSWNLTAARTTCPCP